MRSIIQLSLLTSWFTSAVLPAPVPTAPEPETFLRQQLAFTAPELAALEKGQIIVKLPETSETREVAAFAIERLDISAEFFVERVRDIVNFKKSANVLQIGKFSNPPRLGDLAGLTLDADEIEAIRRCRLHKCGLKMPTGFINRFNQEVDWSAPDCGDRVTALMREMLLKYVQDYLQAGNAALGEYHDKSYTVRLADEMQSLLQPAPYMYEYAPEFQKYLQEFPRSRPP
jgi:hypothetical protein